jgi:hypothetical protein
MLDPLDDIAPSSSQLACALAGLHAGAGWQELLVAKELTDLLAKGTHMDVVEGSRGLGELRCLINQSLYYFWMTMPLIGRGVPSEEVHVPLALNVPDVDPLGTFCDHWQWRVVLTNVLLVLIDVELGGGGEGSTRSLS